MPKRELVSSLLDDNESNILVLTETWLNHDITDDELLLHNQSYHIYRKDRTGKRGGGVLLGVRKSLPSFIIDSNSSLEIVWVAVIINMTKVLIGACYRPPDASTSFVNELRNSITTAVQLCPADSVNFLGDFNFPLINWPNLSSSCRTSVNFIYLTLDFNLIQVVNEPTRGSNILDLILTTAPETIESVVHLNGFSDHDLLQVTISVRLPFSGVSKKNNNNTRL